MLMQVEVDLRSGNKSDQLARLRDLRAKGVKHSWISHLDICQGAILSEADYVCNFQLRLWAKTAGDTIVL